MQSPLKWIEPQEGHIGKNKLQLYYCIKIPVSDKKRMSDCCTHESRSPVAAIVWHLTSCVRWALPYLKESCSPVQNVDWLWWGLIFPSTGGLCGSGQRKENSSLSPEPILSQWVHWSQLHSWARCQSLFCPFRRLQVFTHCASRHVSLLFLRC